MSNHDGIKRHQDEQSASNVNFQERLSKPVLYQDYSSLGWNVQSRHFSERMNAAHDGGS